MCLAMDTVRFIIIILATKNFANGLQLTSSTEKATVGVDFTFTCVTTINALRFMRDITSECTIIGGYPNGTCKFYGSYNTNYKYDCNTNTGVYKLTIPSSFDIDALHGSNWICYPAIDSGKSQTIELFVNDPIRQVTITTSPIDKDQAIIIVDTNHKFICRTNAGRPSSRIQWYISGTNITASAIPQPDYCNNICNGKVTSSSELLYTGNKLDDGKIVYCTAVNVEGQSVRSENKSIVIWYGPINVSISPSTQIYTVIEPTGSVGPVSCIPDDCKPACTTKWSGPNLSDYSLSELNLQNINRNQAGKYLCTASNDAGSRTSVNISVIVNYGPILVTISPSSQSYNVTEMTGSVGLIYCTADCKPACTMTWDGPNIPEGTTTVLNLQNINRNQEGTYQCNATNIIGSHISVKVDITVNYGPGQIFIAPNTLTYTVTEITGSVGPITCTADCKPTCTMTWNGPNIPVGTKSALIINEINRNQAGNYACTATNSYGSKTSTTISVNVNYGPSQVIISPATQTYKTAEIDGGVGPIHCSADCKPECTMQWSGPNIPDDTTSVLNFQNIKRNKDGKYQCTATNVIGSQISVIVTIIVNYGPGQIIISPNTLTYTVTEITGIVGTITCTADCKPTCTMTWNGPNIPVGTMSALTINEINRNQAGNYTCAAINSFGTKTSTAISVNVNYSPTLVIISPSSQNYNVTEMTGSVGPIYCTADCKPACTMTWNGPNIPEGTTTVLNLQNINRNQAGKYKCNATNIIGSHISVKVDITVNYGPGQIIIAPNTLMYTVTEITENVGPIKCTADCKPNCIMTWNGPNIPVGTMSVLTIQNIHRNQTGNYMCTATNSYGSMTSTNISIIVNFKPVVNDLFGNRTYTENTTVLLSCTVQSVPPAKIKWIFKDRTLENTVFDSVNKISQVSTLTIRRVGCFSMGTYNCTAGNIIGEDTREFDIDIICSPRLNDIEYNVSTLIAVKDKAPLNMTVPIIAYPKPNIIWMFVNNGTVLNVTQKTSNIVIKNRVFSALYIANVAKADYGFYSIYAFNDIRKTETSIHSIEVIPNREPISPIFLYVVCKTTTAIIIWKPGSNGYMSDKCYVRYSERGLKVITKQLDQNESNHSLVYIVTDLNPERKYDFYIIAVNQFGESSSRTVICKTDAACSQENMCALKNSEHTTMFGVGVGTLVVALLILAAGTYFVIRNNFRNKNIQSSISEDYTDIQRSNPTFRDDYSTLQSEIDSRPLNEHSINTYEECGNTFDASAYQNIHKMKSGKEKTQKEKVIYDNMDI